MPSLFVSPTQPQNNWSRSKPMLALRGVVAFQFGQKSRSPYAEALASVR